MKTGGEDSDDPEPVEFFYLEHDEVPVGLSGDLKERKESLVKCLETADGVAGVELVILIIFS